MVTVIERNEGHYSAHGLPYGKDYVWCPKCMLVECDCGERLVLTPFKSGCECGRDHTALVREELGALGPGGGISVPWREEYREWLEGARRRPEYDYWLEWSALE